MGPNQVDRKWIVITEVLYPTEGTTSFISTTVLCNELYTSKVTKSAL